MFCANRPGRFRLEAIKIMVTIQVAHRRAELFQQGSCCAESVLQALAESRGIKSGWMLAMISVLTLGLRAGAAVTLARAGDRDYHIHVSDN
jgi:hypothetical protein